MLSRSEPRARAVADETPSGRVARQRLWIGMEEHMLDDRADGQLANFLVALALVEVQITGIARVQYHALRAGVLRAPVMQRGEQLLTPVLALELRVNAQQRQHEVRPRRQAGEHRIVVIEVAARAAQTSRKQKAYARAL